ncbi:MAG: trehalose-phosphatase [Comamonadaceae bacterium]|nr:MAG: trehalose-phosphatase [Comamonadaceae bacterium]
MQISDLDPLKLPDPAPDAGVSPSQAAPAPELLRHLPRINRDTALFLDFDGTLVDIATRPELVQVPPDLVDVLKTLYDKLDGAIAIVSGRALSDLDRFLSPLQLTSAAEHGAQQRLSGGEVTQMAAPDIHTVEGIAIQLASQHSGLRVELKSAAVALHYRQAPKLEAVCLEAMQEAVRRSPGMELLHGKFVFEIKPAGVSKGTAINSFMAQPPFAGRVPMFAGDDTTDEAGFAAVVAMKGDTIKVGEGETLATSRCANPTQLRDWLHACAAGLA